MAHDFRRKAYDFMLDWKSSLADRYALLIEGARRVGKTHLIRRFVEREYISYIFIDFSHKDKLTRDSKAAFIEEFSIQGTLERLQTLHHVSLEAGKSCIVFDEVQCFPIAREAIKQLVEYGKYHYIESGSLVGIKENVKDIVIPSEEHRMKLYPLDFEEFLWACGAEQMAERIRVCFNEQKAMEWAHEQAVKMARIYMVVGGMPQSVEAYISGDDKRLKDSEAAKREILSLYDADIGKYAKGYASKVRALFRHIPAALNTRKKKFHLNDISINARMRRYENAFLWLNDAMVVNIAYNSVNPDIGLEMNMDTSLFKCYSMDTGLLLTQAIDMTKDDGRLIRGILYDKLGINEGMFFENFVAQGLVSRGYNLHFYVKSNPKIEIDFLIRNGIKISPIEVKSAGCRVHPSLDWLVEHHPSNLGTRYIVCTQDYLKEDKTVYLPFYMLHCL